MGNSDEEGVHNIPMLTCPAKAGENSPFDEIIQASVIIVSYNGRQHLECCLGSLAATTQAEIIVVDNASTDGSAAWLARTYPEVRLIHSSVNLGFGGGNNLGARFACGRYLAFLNPDTIVTPGWLDALIEALEADPAVGLATSQILLMDNPQRVNTCGNDVHVSGLTLCRGMGMPPGAFHFLEEVSAVSGAAFAMRRELFESLGGFDEKFFLYMEDTDLSLRARLAGFKCLFVPGSLVYHDYALRFSPLKTYYQERNRYQMLLKLLEWPTLLRLLPVLLLAEIVTWGFVFLRERHNLANKLCAYVWIIRNWKMIKTKRKQVQAMRKVTDRQLLIFFTHRLDYAQTGAGYLPRLANWLFDPFFYVLNRISLAILH